MAINRTTHSENQEFFSHWRTATLSGGGKENKTGQAEELVESAYGRNENR